jgi:Putative peptidoglycan binding domain
MKKFTSLLIGVSLALVGVGFAQQPGESPSKNKEEKPEKTEKVEPKTSKTRGENAVKPEATAKMHAAEGKPGGTVTNPEATTAPKQHGPKNERGVSKTQKAEATTKSEKAAGKETDVSSEASPTASATGGGKQPGKGKNAAVNAKASPSAAPVTSAAPTVAPGNRVTGGGEMKKADPQKVQQVKQQAQQIKQQHKDFRAQPRPDRAPTVTFNANFRIQGSDRWQGPQYEVYRSYHPQRHDRGWYQSHYSRVELISGGYYYWDKGYWYPAWGADPSAEYYAYDAPIYVGQSAEPVDQVIADVQTALQEMGYYQGEVDGLLGPMTRDALTAYQADQGLATTAVIDEPTLDSLDMGS